MKKDATSTTRTSRKRKQRATYSPLPHQEETAIIRALNRSLRKIPSNGEISEDDIDDDLSDWEDEVETEQKDENETEKDKYETKWGVKRDHVRVNLFNQPTGPTQTLLSQRGVKNFFELMFDNKVWHHICKQTNLYAKQQMQLKPDPDWKSLGVGELKSWVGCLMAMGLNKQNNLRMYWESPWRLSMVADRFTRDRFLAIRKYLHLADNSVVFDNKTSHADRLAKVRPLLNLLLQNFHSNYQPSRFLTVDEDMCKFKGRNVMKQYMRAKIVKWGYKIWKLCDSSSAYTLSLDVYTGASETKLELGLAHAVVMKLMGSHLEKNHVVVMDNYFTSVPLFVNLLARSTYACGTVRSNRKYLPEQFGTKQDLVPGKSKFWQSGNLVATLWQDKQVVRILSSCCEPQGADTVTRRRRNQNTTSLPCPPAVKMYSQYMGGVDRSDRMVRTYSVSRASKKWWFRLFYYFLDTCIANSYILYHSSPNHPSLTELEFIKALSLSLIGSSSKESQIQPHAQRKRNQAQPTPRVTASNHWPVKTNQQRKCQHCAKRGSQGPRSKYMCEACQVTLCVDKCFKLYHTRKQ